MAEQTTTGRRAAAGGRGGFSVALLFFCVLGAAVVVFWGRPAAAQQRPDKRLKEFYHDILMEEYDGRQSKDLTADERNAFSKYQKRKAALDRAARATGALGGAFLALGITSATLKDIEVVYKTRAMLADDDTKRAEDAKYAKRASIAFKGVLGMTALALGAAVALAVVTRAAGKKVRKIRHDYRAIRENLATEVSSRAAQKEPVESGADGGEELVEEEEESGASSSDSSSVGSPSGDSRSSSSSS